MPRYFRLMKQARSIRTLLPLPALLLGLALATALTSCVAFQEGVDRDGIRSNARSLVERYQSQTTAGVQSYLDTVSAPWRGHTMPDDLRLESGNPRPIEHPRGDGLVHETLRFTSDFGRGESDDLSELVKEGQFFIYRSEAGYDGQNAVLWLPGLGFSDLALRFVDEFFDAILEEGYILVVYIPPFHLNRLPDGGANNDLLHPGVVESVERFRAITHEIMTGYQWLKDQGVGRIGAWGGSIGAAALLLAGQAVDLDHLAMMIPILDFRTLIPLHPDMHPYLEQLASDGLTSDLVMQAYRHISPVAYPLPVLPERTLILAAEHDQLTPLPVITGYANMHSIDAYEIFPNSHATILLRGRVYERYREWLGELTR